MSLEPLGCLRIVVGGKPLTGLELQVWNFGGRRLLWQRQGYNTLTGSRWGNDNPDLFAKTLLSLDKLRYITRTSSSFSQLLFLLKNILTHRYPFRFEIISIEHALIYLVNKHRVLRITATSSVRTPPSPPHAISSSHCHIGSSDLNSICAQQHTLSQDDSCREVWADHRVHPR